MWPNPATVRGADNGRVRVWKGIRYAAPPLGDLRFRTPEPPERWTGVADATTFGPACPQPAIPNMPLDLGAVAERRLFEPEHLGAGGHRAR
ncbi:Putative para-nitrobenzyl esterase (part 1) [Mycobacterium canettii CIPT 140070017]|nr:Putative para-nitrobenzyl esterase (part 1) [Mycobacterium canettii CIPT 140070017]